MQRTGSISRFMVRNARSLAIIGWAMVSVCTPVWAQDLVFSAKVDKTTVNLGDPMNLVITISGDVSGVQVPPLQLPEGFVVLARSQSTNFSIRSGAMERSTSLNFVLVPQKAGTFKLGPFSLTRQKKTLQTEPIEITVKKPVLPPKLPSSGERFTL